MIHKWHNIKLKPFTSKDIFFLFRGSNDCCILDIKKEGKRYIQENVARVDERTDVPAFLFHV